MFTLKPAQKTHAASVYRSLLTQGSALDTSDTGTGKTISSIAIARHWQDKGGLVAIVCPASVVTAWGRAATKQGVDPIFLTSYDKLRRGNDYYSFRTQIRRNKKHKYFKAEFPDNTLVIFDEVHYCRGDNTQNAKLLVATKNAGAAVLTLSATAARDPSQMKALGYVLGLHDHHKNTKNSWFKWAKRNGCYQDQWFAWKFKKGFDLSPLREDLYATRKIAHGMRVEDLGGHFKDTVVLEDLRNFPRVAGIYEEAGVDEDYVNSIILDLEVKKLDSASAAEEALRGRQLAELEKIPYFVEQAKLLLEEGRSPVVFLNFRESLSLFQESFPESGIIVGGQSSEDRQKTLDDFQEDKIRVMAVSASAGGTGVNLHDTNGNFPRVGLVSPSFSPFVFKQVLGRLPRLGMKTPCMYRVVVAANTIEEHVNRVCLQGTRNMEELFT